MYLDGPPLSQCRTQLTVQVEVSLHLHYPSLLVSFCITPYCDFTERIRKTTADKTSNLAHIEASVHRMIRGWTLCWVLLIIILVRWESHVRSFGQFVMELAISVTCLFDQPFCVQTISCCSCFWTREIINRIRFCMYCVLGYACTLLGRSVCAYWNHILSYLV